MVSLRLLVGVIVLSLLLSPGIGAFAESMPIDRSFAAGNDQPTLASWKIDAAVGGSFAVEADGDERVVVLRGERVVLACGEQDHLGQLIESSRWVAVPGRRYTLTVQARGEGQLALGAVGWADKYSPIRVEAPAKTFALTPQWQTFAWTFTPADQTMYASVRFLHQGWLGHVALRSPALEADIAPAALSVAAGSFVFAQGEAIELRIASERPQVKVLMYGPGGVPPGPGGRFGGSDAWTDHFQAAASVQATPGLAAPVVLSLPPGARPGFYRAVAVDLASGQSAETHFHVQPAELAADLKQLAEQAAGRLPQNACLVFLGDSLTAMFPDRNYVSLLTAALRHHRPDVRVINAGVGGNNIKLIADRLQSTVLAHQPTHVYLFEGANDCKRYYNPATGLKREWAYPAENYEATYRDVLSSLKSQAGVEVVVMTMAPGDPRILDPMQKRREALGLTANAYCMPEDTQRVVAIQKQLAEQLGLQVLDTHAALLQAMQARPQEYLVVDDGVHLSEYGNREVAMAVLRFLAR